MSGSAHLEITDGVAWLRLDRPDSLNALDLPTATELSDHLLRVSADPAARVVVITGSGRAFSAGGDLPSLVNDPRGLPAALHELATRVHLCVAEIRRMPKPVIAVLNGVAAGGGFSLALACDFRVMAASARLVQGYTSRGLAIDGGGTFALPRLVGLARALEIAAFDEPISAERALAWGLATRVVPDDRLLEELRAMAATLAGRPIHAFGQVKRLLSDSTETALEAQLERERVALVACAAHPEGLERVRAFVEKRVSRPPDPPA